MFDFNRVKKLFFTVFFDAILESLDSLLLVQQLLSLVMYLTLHLWFSFIHWDINKLTRNLKLKRHILTQYFVSGIKANTWKHIRQEWKIVHWQLRAELLNEISPHLVFLVLEATEISLKLYKLPLNLSFGIHSSIDLHLRLLMDLWKIFNYFQEANRFFIPLEMLVYQSFLSPNLPLNFSLAAVDFLDEVNHLR